MLRGATVCCALALTASAHAEPELPSYQDRIVIAAWLQVDKQITQACRWPQDAEGIGVPLSCEPEALRTAIRSARGFERDVVEDGRIRYLIGLAYRHLGDLATAERCLREALQLAPNRAEAWSDLGELLANQQDWVGAAEAFTHVTELVPSGPRAWPGWLALAQVHAQQQNVAAFESDLRQALRHGLSLRTVAGQPAWKAFLRDPVVGPAVERMATIYGGPEVLESLRAP